jgi:Cu(I)/Ag(I) efflux system membrane fusion protein
MDLIPADSNSSGDTEALAPNEVELSDRARAMAQIRTTRVHTRAPSGVTRRLLGRIQPAETRTRRLTAWTGGRLDELVVSEHGVEIRRGQKIAEIYSPDIYAAHRELLAAKKQLDALGGATRTATATGQIDAGSEAGPQTSPARRSAKSTFEAARRRLELLGIGPRLIDEMTRADEPWKQVPIRAQFGGTVIDLKVREGDYVKEGEPLYRLADLNEVWVELDAYESDLSHIERGMRVRFSVPALPGRTYKGEVSFIDSVIDDESRTAQVRVVIDNRKGRLKPGMWVEAELLGGEDIPGAGDDAKVPVIPESAPLYAGERSLVYVEQPDTNPVRYAAREVKLGSKVGEVYPVLGGLRPGERVVTHGAFVLDADLQIRGGRSMMARADDDERRQDASMLSPSPAFRGQLADIVEAYLKMKVALAADEADDASDALARMVAAIREAEPAGESVRQAFDPIRSRLLGATDAARSADTASLEQLRAAFGPASESLKEILSKLGNPTDAPLRIAHCPMAFDGKGADWLQPGETIENPYFGSEMLKCGNVESTIGAGQYLMEDKDGE